MSETYQETRQLQQLVLDIIKVNRHHYIPETDRHENVVDHSFTLALLCWHIFSKLNPVLDQARILKYAMIHDFNERGQSTDISTFAAQESREEKYRREAREIENISAEFASFPDFVNTLKKYNRMEDEESKFVYTVDRLQSLILGEIDNWRPHKGQKVSYEALCNKYEEVIANSPECLKELARSIYLEARENYYDKPSN